MADNGNLLTLPSWIRVLMPTGRVEEMKLETYLAGAVAAEIGATAPLEALKAQALASRTYVVSARRHPEHNADVCATAHCQKWIRVDDGASLTRGKAAHYGRPIGASLTRGKAAHYGRPIGASLTRRKAAHYGRPIVSAPDVFRALTETWGMVATFDSALISAFFFEHCDGHTRNAEAMLIPGIPYLRGVDCPCGFLTLKGHGVGMCQRGAIMMARRGASFEQILSHYYRGVTLTRIESAKHVAPEREELKPPRAHKKPVKPVTQRPTPRRPAQPAVIQKPRVAEPQIQAEPITPRVQAPAPRVSAPVVETVAPIEPPTPLFEPSAPVETAPIAPMPTAQPSQAESEPTVQPVSAAPPIIAEADLPALEQVVIGTGKRMHVDHLPGGRMIAGALLRAGIAVSIEDPRGNRTIVFSGSAVHYGAGGFETVVDEDGAYHVTIDGHALLVHVRGETVFIHAE